MSELIVKDNALMNASYNLDLVEQRLILLAIVEARESGKGINANDPLTVHAESYINQFGVHRTTAYQALKMLARTYLHVNSAIKKNENVDERILQVDGYHKLLILTKRQRLRLFCSCVVPLITRLEEQFTQYDIEQISGLSVPMLSVCMNY